MSLPLGISIMFAGSSPKLVIAKKKEHGRNLSKWEGEKW